MFLLSFVKGSKSTDGGPHYIIFNNNLFAKGEVNIVE